MRLGAAGEPRESTHSNRGVEIEVAPGARRAGRAGRPGSVPTQSAPEAAGPGGHLSDLLCRTAIRLRKRAESAKPRPAPAERRGTAGTEAARSEESPQTAEVGVVRKSAVPRGNGSADGHAPAERCGQVTKQWTEGSLETLILNLRQVGQVWTPAPGHPEAPWVCATPPAAPSRNLACRDAP